MSGKYVQGPMLRGSRRRPPAYFGTQARHRRRQRHGRDLAGAHGPRHRPGRRGHHPRQHLLRHGRGDLDRRAPRRSSWTATRRRSASTRPRSRRRSRPRPRPSSPCTSTASAPTCRRIWEIAEKHKLRGHRGQRPGHRRPRRHVQAGRAAATPSRTSFIIQKNLGSFGDGGMVFTNRDDDRRDRSASCATTAPTQRDHHSFGFNSRLDDLQAGVLSAKLKHITAVDRPAHRAGRALHAGLKDVQDHQAARTRRPATATCTTST